jgi:S1/P1 Nuclease
MHYKRNASDFPMTAQKLLRYFAILFFVSGHINAWGPEGHEIVANIALHDLSNNARTQIAAILGSTTPDAIDLASVANWADKIRPFQPETAPWHFVDIPLQHKTYQPSVDCKNDDCVVAQIGLEVDALTNKSGNQLNTLRFLVHFVGDIHQPLHCEDNNDRGGNNVHVRFHDQAIKLHQLWDSGLLEQMEEQDGLTARLILGITAADRADWSTGDPKDWALESHALAVKPAYALVPKRQGRLLPVLDESYETAADPIVSARLQRAGVRLAVLLNRIYGN